MKQAVPPLLSRTTLHNLNAESTFGCEDDEGADKAESLTVYNYIRKPLLTTDASRDEYHSHLPLQLSIVIIG